MLLYVNIVYKTIQIFDINIAFILELINVIKKSRVLRWYIDKRSNKPTYCPH